jgi:thiazole synthase
MAQPDAGTEPNTWSVGPLTFHSRLVLGTGKYPSHELMRACHEAAGTEMVTVAIRRVNLRQGEPSLLDFVDRKKIRLLPNTAGCYTVKDAILTAQLGREALGTEWVKLEVIGDEKTLMPDVEGTLEAARELVKQGFRVLPYVPDDVVACLKLEALGVPAVMPLAAPIGSGLGIRNSHNLRIILECVKVPVIVDAGVGTASDVALAMELGVTAVLLNTAVALAKDPVKMATAMRKGVEAGRLAFEAGRIPRKLYASASSPIEGVVGT